LTQVSAEHGSPSLQSASVAQQSSMVAWTQCGGEPEHESAVQGLESAHWESAVQQPDIICDWQVPVIRLQASSVHGLPSLQSALAVQTRQLGMGVPVQMPDAHMSPEVQALPSLQGVPLSALCVHPVAALQPSVVHGLPSLQFSAVPGWHTPA